MARASLFKNNSTGSKRAMADSPTTASSAAVLLLLITAVMVLYILFIPPAERARLLEGDDPVNTVGINSHTTLLGTKTLDVSPGKINYVKNDKIEHDLASFRIYTETDAQIISEINSMYVKNSAFERKFKEMPFNIEKDMSENIYLSFNVFQPSGDLKIYLNGILISEGALNEGSPRPILLPQEYLNDNNLIYFKVSSPGFAFWRVNEYTLQNVRVTGDVTDDDHSFHMQTFYIDNSEMENFEKATLEFYPDCDAGNVNKISIEINRNKIYDGIPDCNMVNRVAVGKESLDEGKNSLEFFSDKGSYIIDMVAIDVNLEKPDYPIYYFDLSDELFITSDEANEFCGKIDGLCPSGCDEYEDKDCCFADSRSNYWCDVRTNNPRDRCVNSFLAEYEERCPSGYEDNRGNVLEELEGDCGDDNDDYCPSGCNALYDKDCCYTEDENNYWCSDIPLTGIDSVCTAIVTQSECDACPNKYYNYDRETPNCGPTEIEIDGVEKLKADVDIIMEIDFVDEDYKKVDFLINGMTVPVDTYYLSYSRVINEHIRSGTNSLQIIPRGDLVIAQIEVSIE